MAKEFGVCADEYDNRTDWWCGPIDLNKYNIKFTMLEQKPGDVIITAPKVIHLVWSEVYLPIIYIDFFNRNHQLLLAGICFMHIQKQ